MIHNESSHHSHHHLHLINTSSGINAPQTSSHEREICNSQCGEDIDAEIASNVTYEEDDCNRESIGQQINPYSQFIEKDLFDFDDYEDDFFNNGDLKNDSNFIDIPDKF